MRKNARRDYRGVISPYRLITLPIEQQRAQNADTWHGLRKSES